MQEIRAFRKEDIPEVADLHRRVFRTAESPSPELLNSYQSYFTQIFLGDDWRDDNTQSLVYAEQGRITGFFGAVTSRMSYRGETVRVKLGSQAIVEPGRRGVAGLKLYGTFLDSDHDLFIGDEATAAGREVWEGFGGVTSLPYSMYWMYALRPCKFARYILESKRLAPALPLRAAAPVAWMVDRFAAPILRKLAGPAPDGVVFEEKLTCGALLDCLAECAGDKALRPAYDRSSLNRILQRAGKMQRNGSLQQVLLKTAEGEIAGWYIYYLSPNGISEVVQLYANSGLADAVLDHLIRHADARGASMLRGRVESDVLDALSRKHCLFRFGSPWAMVYSRRPELLQALGSGDAFFSRLEGEWCLHFQ